MIRARSESVPGTLNVFDESPGSRVEATTPTTSTTSQTATTSVWWRRTARVQRSGIARQAYATRPQDGCGKPGRSRGRGEATIDRR